MATNRFPAPSGRRVIDELPSRISLLPGEVDLLQQYLADVLEQMLIETNANGDDEEAFDERHC